MKRFVKAAIAAALVTTVATPVFAAVSVSPQERAKIESVVHDYLLQKPEVIMQAVQELQKRQYQQAESTIKSTQKNVGQFANALFRTSSDPVVGNADGTVTVVEFFDYQCPHCIDMAPVIDAIMKSNSNVRFVFKEFPIRGEMSDFAARAALAANMQGKYYEFHHAVLTAKQPLTQDTVMQAAKDAGLDIDKLKKDMDSDAVKNQLKSNVKLAQDLKLFGTPAFFIGKTDAKASSNIAYVPGGMNQNQLQGAIDNAGK
ncbi:MAG: outer membrane protein [uncultured bacterium]|nr:MAG: outer membrane protein [uncultured bacterium]